MTDTMNINALEFVVYEDSQGEQYGVITFNLGNGNEIDLHLKKQDYITLFNEMKSEIYKEEVN